MKTQTTKIKLLTGLSMCIIAAMVSCKNEALYPPEKTSLPAASKYSPNDLEEEVVNGCIENACETFSLEVKNEMARAANNRVRKLQKSNSNVLKEIEYTNGAKLQLKKDGTFYYVPNDSSGVGRKNLAYQVWYRKESNIRAKKWKWEEKAWYPGVSSIDLNNKLKDVRSSNGEYFVYIQIFNRAKWRWELLKVKDSKVSPTSARFLVTQSFTGTWGIDKLSATVSMLIFKNCGLTVDAGSGNFLGHMYALPSGKIKLKWDFRVPAGYYQCDGRKFKLPFDLVADSTNTGSYLQSFYLGTPKRIKPSYPETTAVLSDSCVVKIDDSQTGPYIFPFKIETMTDQEFRKYSAKLSLKRPVVITWDILGLQTTLNKGTVFFKNIE